jgi:multidrug efflux pump subunit AcrA (membrane-fusion protein)
MFVRVRLPLGKPRKVLTVPELAVLTKDSSKFVYVVGDKGKVELRAVKLGQLDGDLRVIEEGLKPDDWVAVSALGKFAEGDTVEPKRTSQP